MRLLLCSTRGRYIGLGAGVQLAAHVSGTCTAMLDVRFNQKLAFTITFLLSKLMYINMETAAGCYIA